MPNNPPAPDNGPVLSEEAMGLRVHDLKTWPEFFEAIWDGRKTFEIRLNDRDYQVGDLLSLREWNPTTTEYTGRVLQRQISYVMEGGQFGINPDYVVLGFANLIRPPQPSNARGRKRELPHQGTIAMTRSANNLELTALNPEESR